MRGSGGQADIWVVVSQSRQGNSSCRNQLSNVAHIQAAPSVTTDHDHWRVHIAGHESPREFRGIISSDAVQRRERGIGYGAYVCVCASSTDPRPMGTSCPALLHRIGSSDASYGRQNIVKYNSLQRHLVVVYKIKKFKECKSPRSH